VKRAQYYQYQTAGDYWEDEPPPFEALFTTSMEWYGLVLLGLAERDQVPTFDPFADTGNLEGDPKYDQSGWELSDSDRDLFLRIG
jgi:hypothetical protein